MTNKYEVVLTFQMPSQKEVFVIWDISLYSAMRNKENFVDFIMDGNKNGFGESPVNVYTSIYMNPEIMEVETPFGKDVLLLGKHCLDLDVF